MSQGRRVVILGAASAMAEAYARLLAAEGARFVLVGRRADRLAAIAADLTARGAVETHIHEADLADAQGAMGRFEAMIAPLGGLDELFLAYGALGDQEKANADPDAALASLAVNFTSAAAWLQAAAPRMARGGAIVVIGSVAGDRGRQSNYVYGAAKAGLAAFCDGLRHRLAPEGVSVTLVKPGFVDSPMTAHLKKGGPLWATPAQVAADMRRAAAKGQAVIYTPWFWAFVMMIIRAVPRPIFHKTKL